MYDGNRLDYHLVIFISQIEHRIKEKKKAYLQAHPEATITETAVTETTNSV
jgi:hypothetical protein